MSVLLCVGGHGNESSLQNDAVIQTMGKTACGLSAQSVGGTGGQGMEAHVANDGASDTTGADSHGILVQSIGGNGRRRAASAVLRHHGKTAT